jgi:hypothetical protein
MFNAAYRWPFHWMDEIELRYWQQALRLTRLGQRAQHGWNDLREAAMVHFEPFRTQWWIPALSGLAGAFTAVIWLALAHAA